MRLDEFESRFKRADKQLFEYQEVAYKRPLLITDVEEEAAAGYRDKLEAAFAGITAEAEWGMIAGDQFKTVPKLEQLISKHEPDIIVTHRHLRHANKRQSFTLGIYVDVLTQAMSMPVLLVPFLEDADWDGLVKRSKNVMVMTDHLQGDFRLIDSALPFTGGEGSLWLAHIEDRQTYERYMDEISRIPAIETTIAQQELLKELLKEPADYINSCVAVLKEKLPGVKVESVVKLGDCLREAKFMVENHEVGLVVVNTKDENQLAMHGNAYAIAVELQNVPLLLL